MHIKKTTFLLIPVITTFIVGTVAWLAYAQPVQAQCGSQASSCKNCHEAQAQDPVNNDGTAWHTQHAFGDFCYLCHAGNNQAMDEAAAHTGMVAPLSDINASCSSCHPTDTLAMAQIYATTLGVEIGSDSGSPSGGQPGSTGSSTESAPTTTNVDQAPFSVPADTTNLVDYVDQYNTTSNGRTPTNPGNVILIVLAILLAFGGGLFVILNEKLVNLRFKVSYGEPRRTPNADEVLYPPSILEMLPAMGGLKPESREALKKILDKPDKADKVLNLIKEMIAVFETKE